MADDGAADDGASIFSSTCAGGTSRNGPVSPDDFLQGMKVEHPQYGVGEIVALSGAGPARQATVDFAASAGRMRFILAACPLRPLSVS